MRKDGWEAMDSMRVLMRCNIRGNWSRFTAVLDADTENQRLSEKQPCLGCC